MTETSPRTSTNSRASSTATTSSTPGRRRRSLDPLVIAGGSRLPTSGTTPAREYLDFSSQLVNVNIGHQHPAVVQAIQEQAELLATIAPATANLARGEAAKRIIGHAPDGLPQGVLHQRRRRRERERDPDGAPAHRPRQGALDVPLVPRQHRRGDRRDRRLAPHAERVRPRPRALLRPLPLPLASSGRRRPSRSRSARCTTSSASSRPRGRRRSRRSCSRPIPGTAGILVPPPGLPRRRARAVRPARHHADPRRGDVRASAAPGGWFAFDGYDVRPRPHHLREGRELGLRAGRAA